MVSIAPAFFLLDSGQTNRQTNRQTQLNALSHTSGGMCARTNGYGYAGTRSHRPDPKKLPFPLGKIAPSHLIHDSLSPYESIAYTPFLPVQPVFAVLVIATHDYDRQDRQTNTLQSSNTPHHKLRKAMRPNNIEHSSAPGFLPGGNSPSDTGSPIDRHHRPDSPTAPLQGGGRCSRLCGALAKITNDNIHC